MACSPSRSPSPTTENSPSGRRKAAENSPLPDHRSRPAGQRAGSSVTKAIRSPASGLKPPTTEGNRRFSHRPGGRQAQSTAASKDLQVERSHQEYGHLGS